MTDHLDFLVEIQTEELPPKILPLIAKAFSSQLEKNIRANHLQFDDLQSFATPRRLAILVKKLASAQADYLVEKRGPALQAAFDATGNPTPACLGFARSLGVTPQDLHVMRSEQGEWLGFNKKEIGKK